MDSPPRTKHRPNKAKIDAHQPLTSELNSTLTLKLKTFHKELHAEFWGDTKDTLIGPHLFLTNAQIQHLCHLMHADVLWDIDDLYNNFKWNWMSCHGESLFSLIQSVHKPNPASNTKASVNTSPIDFPAESGIGNVASSSSKRMVKSSVKIGPGSQCCRACGTLGHNSKLHLCLILIHSLTDYSRVKSSMSHESHPNPIQCYYPSSHIFSANLFLI